MLRRNARRAAFAVALAALAGAAAPAVSQAQTALPPCTSTIGYDASIPTWQEFWAANPDPDAVVPLGWGSTGSGGGASANGSGTPGPTGRNLSRLIDRYWDGLVAATANNPRVRLIKKPVGKTATGLRDIQFYVLGTPQNIANLDGANGDAAFWRGVRSGEISEEIGLEAAATKPAFAWITATPHGGESAAAESITRQAYELLARTDCENERRLKLLDYFLQPVRNPDGRDAISRTTAWGFDPNRDFGTWNQAENRLFVPQMNTYPGVFFIDAHQTSSGYFFPPNEDPVHHEISHFALDFIQKGIGPALQDAFNSQSIAFRNYSQYDLFTPEYGDTVPALIMGAAGMTYEKGTSEAYAKQVYDHYLAIDTTIKATVQDKTAVTSRWVEQWEEAVEQGAACKLQENTLVSPLHDTLKQNPDYDVCGYFFKPDQHTGDLAALIENLQRVGVRIYRLDTPVAVNGYHEYGVGDAKGDPVSQNGVTLPAGTFYIPMEQGMKHWIQAVLGENPFIPYDYYYDVVTWSYPLQRGLAGSGFLTQKLSPGIQMTEIATDTKYGTAPAENSPVYAFNTDSARGLGLAIDLLDKGVNVYRGVQPFTQGGKRFYTGAALVDAASLAGAGIDLTVLGTMADKRDTPISGLTGYPVQRRQLSVPKVGVYTNSPFIPTNPNYITGANVAGNSGHCALSGLPTAQSPTSYCEATHALSVKLGLPASTSTTPGRIMPVTSTDIANGRLVNENFTALINPNGTIATTDANGITPTGTALKAFINGGGNYIGINAAGVNAARTISAATLDTSPASEYPNLLTPGSTFDATFDTANPVAWGFDLGGWIYRDSNGNPVFNPATVGTGTSVVKYKATPDEKYGYETNATPLWDRPAVVEQPYGSGRSVLFGFNPFYRSWKEQDERLVLNAVLFPKGGVVTSAAPTPESAAPAPQAAAIEPVAEPVKGQSAAAAVRAPVAKAHATDRDVRITVKRKDGAKLKAAVRAANLSTKVKRNLRYSTTKRSVTLIVKGARTSNEHTRKDWVSRVVNGLDRRKVTPISALV